MPIIRPEDLDPVEQQAQGKPFAGGQIITPDMFDPVQGQTKPSQPLTLEASPFGAEGYAPSFNPVAPQGSIPGQIAKGIQGNLWIPGALAGASLGGMAGGVGAIPGAIIGGMTGQSMTGAMDAIQGKPITSEENIKNIGMAGYNSAMGEMGGQVAGAALSKFFAPGRKWIYEQIGNMEVANAAQKLAEEGVPLSPELIAPSKIAKGVHWLAERIQPGKSIVDSYRKQSMDAIMEMRRNFIEEMGLPPVGSMPLGQAQEEIKGVFKTFREATGPKEVIKLPKTKEFIDGVTDDMVGKSSIEYLNKVRETIKSGALTAPEIESINSALWPKGKAYSRMSPLDRQWREDLLNNLYSDLGAHETSMGANMAQLLQQAKGTTREIYQAQFIERLLDRATNNETMQFNPLQFYDLVRKNQNNILRQLDKEQATNLFNFAEKMKAAAPERQLLRESKESPMFSQLMSGAPAGALMTVIGQRLMSGDIAGAAAFGVPVGFQAIVARSLMNPSGVIRKWLTTGYNPPTTLLRTGAMEASQSLTKPSLDAFKGKGPIKVEEND